ncbi:hypothetical protein COU57_02195 [Candidatus Pacearchaeota archaeon CG10_big_fil_rev_8_21_14_0_10_32_14]|nr:MAG: hypothetical protein COU57_02195 [Candidatus Pacearchaeota archaeon CG10_big_fil_rev_8_21_14_0_10_32_14]
MKLEFYPIDYDTVEINNKDIIKIYGRTSQKKTVCILDYIDNFFYVLSEKSDKIIKSLNKKNIKSRLVNKNYLGKKVSALQIFSQHKEFKTLTEDLLVLDGEAQILETDISQITRYIIEKDIKPLKKYDISGETLNNSSEFQGLDLSIETDFVIKLETVLESKSQEMFSPKIMAFDIETEEFEIGKGPILMISVVTSNIKKVLTWKHNKSKIENVEFFKDEADMLEAFFEIINKEKPDILTGYFSDNFDLPYIRARAEKIRVPQKLGPERSRILFSRGRMMNASIKGIVHIDIFRFIQTAYAQYMESETLSLNEVSKELLGEEKINVEHRGKKSAQIKDHEWREYFIYNLQDSILTYKLFEKIWIDLVGFTEVMQEPLYDVSRDGMSRHVEDYIIHNLKRFNEIAIPRPSHSEISVRRLKERNVGAFVLQPIPKLYENLAMFDFTSYWPSIIVSFNLSASTLLGNKKPKDFSPSKHTEVDVEGIKYYFSKEKGFFPILLEEIIAKRKEAKHLLKTSHKDDPLIKARSAAYKVLANSSYGYLGFFGARYYSYESQGATTALSRDYIQKIIAKINSAGFQTIYSDTDSIALLLNKYSKNETLDFLKSLNKELPGIMELELEDFYRRGIFVTKRSGDFGAKKKYALMNYEGKLKIRGFETVRRDWCTLARDTQSKILKMILDDGDQTKALKYVKEITKKLRAKEIDKNLLIIKTQLKKPLDEYKASTPHVIIARKMLKEGLPVSMGTLIEYFIADTKEKSKKGPIRDQAKLINEFDDFDYDIDYYMNKQIIPSVENIFAVLNVNIEEELASSKQKKLDF